MSPPRAKGGSDCVRRAMCQVGVSPSASWAELMRRAFEVDVLACPRCGGRRRLIALIEAWATVQRILTHLALPADVPRPAPARAPRSATATTNRVRRAPPQSAPGVALGAANRRVPGPKSALGWGARV